MSSKLTSPNSRLLISVQLHHTFARFEEPGSNRVDRVHYDESKKRVFINAGQYFSGIDEELWHYHIGGYQVLAKWLKDRKKRSLSLEEIQHYIRIARALQLTIQYQQKIDKLYPAVEKSLITG